MTSVIPVTSTSAGQVPVTAAPTATTASTPSSGLAGVPSSLSSAATPAATPATPATPAATPATPAAPQGLSAQISACISSVCKAIRNCLAKLPVIGGWFQGNSSSSTTINNPVVPAAPSVWTDVERLQVLRTAFHPTPATSSSGATIAEVPTAANMNYLLGEFRAIQSPAEKIVAFQMVQTAQNSNDEITRQFFDTLDEGTSGGTAAEATRNAIRYYTYLAVPLVNGDRSTAFENRNLGQNFGGHVAGAHPRHELVRTGVQNLHAALVAQAATAPAGSSRSVASA
jgi:hypothetical protein